MFEYVTLRLTSMKKVLLFSMALLLAGVLIVPDSYAEDDTRKDLPARALARLSKDYISGCSYHLPCAYFRPSDGGVAYSPDGARLAVVSRVGVRLYDAHTGTEVDLLQGHTGWVSSVSFSPDGSLLASGSYDGTILLWDVP